MDARDRWQHLVIKDKVDVVTIIDSKAKTKNSLTCREKPMELSM